MKRFLNLSVVLLVSLVFSCSSSHSSTDSDIIPDSDSDDTETIADDDTDSEDSDFIDDSDEMPDDTNSINGYARCYDEIPDEPYEGFFADPNIVPLIKKILGYDDDYELKEEDLEKITEITLSAKDLRGIEKLVNLEYVKFKDTEGNIYDFTPLSNLKKLKKVFIYFRPPAELDPSEHHENMTCLDGSFSLLTTLETLEIENTHLKEVKPIEQLVNLKTLELSYNQIDSLPENLGNLQKLEWLAFDDNKIKNIEPLKLLINLKELFFYDNYVEDIFPLKDLVNLTRLGCSNNNIKEISPITNLVNLTYYLGLNQNRIEKIPKEIVNLKKLQELDLTFNNISDLPNLKGLSSLVTMRLSNNALNNEDLMKLDNLESVKFLDVALNKITKVPIMKNLKSLQELYLNYNNITDLSGFADNESFPALKSVYLGSNKISDAEALRKREGLSRLSIGKNCIKDLSPLEELKENGTYISGMNEQLESCENTTTIFKEGE